MAETEKPDLATLTVQLLSAYVSNNTVPSNELAGLIQSTRTALSGDVGLAEPPQPEFVPATTARKSLASRDHIISLIDGKPYKSLKRHLSTRGLTPAEYRERYKLPQDYPMVAPAYSEQRRDVAQRLGLGRKKAAPDAPAETPVANSAPAEETPAPVPAPRQTRKLRAKALEVSPSIGKKPAATNGSVTPPSEAEATAPVDVGTAKTKPRKNSAVKAAPASKAKPTGKAAKVDSPKPAARGRRASRTATPPADIKAPQSGE